PGVDRQYDTLAAKPLRALFDQLRREHGRGVDRNLIGPGPQHTVHILDAANAAADCQRNEYLGGGPLDHVDHRRALIAASGDIVEDQLVGARRVIHCRQGNRVARIAVVEERDTLDYTPAFDIQAGNNTSSQHDLPNLPRCLVALLDLLSFDFFELLAQSRRQRVDHLNIAPIQLAQMGGMLALSLVDMADPA